MTSFQKVKTIQSDERGRLPLAKFIEKKTRYQVEISDEGQIKLTPLVSMTVAERDELIRKACA